jgi:hypothetical protein
MIVSYFEMQVINNIHYINGQPLNGVFTSTYPNGNKNVTCPYKEGKLHGDYIEYYDNDRMRVLITYEEGNMTLCMEWNEDGKLMSQIRCSGSIEAHEIFHVNGKLAVRSLKIDKVSIRNGMTMVLFHILATMSMVRDMELHLLPIEKETLLKVLNMTWVLIMVLILSGIVMED